MEHFLDIGNLVYKSLSPVSSLDSKLVLTKWVIVLDKLIQTIVS